MPTQPAAFGTLTSGWSLGGLDPYQFGISFNAVTIRDMPPIEPRQEGRPGGHGNLMFPEHYRARPIAISAPMWADTPAQLQSNFDELKAVLSTFSAGSPKPLRLVDGAATDRFYRCHYAGQCAISEIGPRLASYASNVTIGLAAEPPFAMAVNPTTTTFVATTAGKFQEIATGTFGSPCRVILTGAATDPELIFGDSIFIWKANRTTSFENLRGTSTAMTFSGTGAQKAALFSPSSAGYGHAFLASGAYQLTATVTGNKDAGSWFFVVEPQFDSIATGTKVLFEHRYDANNYLRLYYFNSGGAAAPSIYKDRRFLFQKTVAGNTYFCWSTEQDFVSGDVLKIAFDYGASGMRVFLDGDLDASNSETTGLTANPTSATFNQNGSNFTAAMKVHWAAGWSSQLTETEHSLIAADPVNRIRNDNQKLKWTGTLDAGDTLEFTNEDGVYKGELHDVSADTLTAKFPDATYVIPHLAASTTSVFVVGTIASVSIQHRNFFL